MSVVQNPPLYYVYSAEDHAHTKTSLQLVASLMQLPDFSEENRESCLAVVVGVIRSMESRGRMEGQ